MPLQNRVTPWGRLEAAAVRYPSASASFGNRGVLHDDSRTIVRPWKTKAWLACKLTVHRKRKVQRDDNRSFNARKRVVMRPGYYTELFFLDNFVATAAGHRPCACCRRQDYNAFVDAWARAHPSGGPWTASSIDAVLHEERLGQRRPVWAAPVSSLPDGAFVSMGDDDAAGAWLCWQGHMLRWSHAGYCERVAREDVRDTVKLLTPRSLVQTMREGFVPGPVDATATALLEE